MLFAALTPQETLRLKRRYRRHHKTGFPAEWVEGAQIFKRWPEFSRKVRAVLFYPSIARVLPRRFQEVLSADVRRLGVKILRFQQPIREIGRAHV